MSEVHTFDHLRGFALFLGDAYEGGQAWDQPSSSTLGTATLYGYRVATTDQRDSNGQLVGAETVIAEAVTGTERSYLVPWPGETAGNFARRKSLAIYVNLVEPIVDAYCDAIVPRVKRDLGDAQQYLSNLDGDGQSWGDLVGDAALQAALDGVCAVVLDLPEANPATTRAEEREMGVGLAATVVPVASWAWMRLDHRGRIEEFAYADTSVADESAGTSATPGQKVSIWVWRADDREPGGMVKPGGWAVYETSIAPGQELGKARSATTGEARPTRFGSLPAALKGRVPVVFAYHRRVRGRVRSPRGKSLAASPATIGRQIYQLLSQVEDTQRRSPPFLSVPTAARNGLDPATRAKVGPDQAIPAPEGAGTPEWVTFPAEPLADLRAHVAFLVGLAYRVSGLEVQADTSAQVQSGEALRVRSRDFEARAQRFAKSLEDFERRALDIAAALLGLDRARLTVTYPQRYVLGDPSELLAAAVLLLQTLGDRIGSTATVEAVRQALNSALALDDATAMKVLAEVEAKMNSAQAPAQKELFGYDYDAGVVKVNEVRATKGLGPIPGGDVSVLEWMKGIEARFTAQGA
jgi:hypothetical protein